MVTFVLSKASGVSSFSKVEKFLRGENAVWSMCAGMGMGAGNSVTFSILRVV